MTYRKIGNTKFKMLHSLKEYTDHVLEFKKRRPFVSFQFTLHIMNFKQFFVVSHVMM